MNKKKRGKNSMNKKAMGVGQVFIYIVAAISFALIMIFGYKAINSFLQSGEQVQLVQFKTDIESSIKKIYTEYGSVRVEKYRIPGAFEQVCLVNMEYIPSDEELKDLREKNVYASKVWEDARDAQKVYKANSVVNPKDGYDSVDENVFLTPQTERLTQLKVYRIDTGEYNETSDSEIETGFICEKITKGSFTLVLEGRGDRTKVLKKVK